MEANVQMDPGRSPHFVQPVDPNLLCAVCGGVMQQAVLTPCGHAFCSLCLHTWMDRAFSSPSSSSSPSSPTCPECRAHLTPDLIKPVHALRNLVRGLHVWCPHRDEGCGDELTLDQLPAHLKSSCPFHPVECAGCGQQVRRVDLAEHHITCPVIAASIDDDADDDDAPEKGEEVGGGVSRQEELGLRPQGSKPFTTRDVSFLLSRIRALETRVDRLLQELKCARSKTLALEREVDKMSGNLLHKNHHPQDRHLQDTMGHFLQQVCARTPETVAKLSFLIARHLLERPRGVDGEEVFRAIGRCYDTFHWAGPDGRHDVHMLLATAYASNWFSPAQRTSLQCWLKTLTRTSPRPATRLFNT